jgi:hypothetical protein
MATGNIKGGKRNYAKPTAPTAASATASEVALEATVTYTPATNGPLPASYVITGTSGDGGASVSGTSTSQSSATVSGLSTGKSYTFNVAGSNYNGAGSTITSNEITAATIVTVDYLVVAGGGAGGRGENDTGAGGGGAGGLRSTISPTGGGGTAETAIQVPGSTDVTVTVGAGGPGTSTQGTDGSNSIFSTITSLGGGGGGWYAPTEGNSGGSGGGGGVYGGASGGGAGTANQGFNGRAGLTGPIRAGGGGGSGELGGTDGVQDGGDGVSNNITGTAVNYAGGGAGSGVGTDYGSGGDGGGAASNAAGSANTGGGGSGSRGGNNGGAGGSGVVILRYADTFTITIGAGLTGTESEASGGYKRATITAGTGNVSWA